MIITFIFLGVVIVGVVIWMVIAGRKRDEAWMQFASEIGAEFVKGRFCAPARSRRT